MAGGIQTCQLSNLPISCGEPALAVIVRQSVYSHDKWVPATAVLRGTGNDDFVALDDLQVSALDDLAAVQNGCSSMETMLESAFIGNASCRPVCYLEAARPKTPLGIVYIRDDVWQRVLSLYLKSARSPTDPNDAALLLQAAKMTVADLDRSAKYREDTEDTPPTTWHSIGYSIEALLEQENLPDSLARSVRVLDSHSEHSFGYSLNDYVPGLCRMIREGQDQESQITGALRSLLETVALDHILTLARSSWIPIQNSIQDYDIHPIRAAIGDMVSEVWSRDQ